MRRSLTALVTGLVLVMAVVGITAAAGGGRPLSTPMSGVEEVPGPGDANATGQADLTINQGLNQVCFDLSWANIDGTVVAAHVHRGPPGVAGPVVVPLFSGAFSGTDSASGCVQGVDPGLIKAIRQDPSSFYVNVHSVVFPAGAIRGQLGD